jgi:hypothetical protein
MIQENNDVSQENNSTEQTITMLIMRLNQSLSRLDSISAFPPVTKPHNRDLYRSVYCDIFELSSLTRASLSKSLIGDLNNWRTNFSSGNFVNEAIDINSRIYDELSESGMIDIRARKSSMFPIEYYADKLEVI